MRQKAGNAVCEKGKGSDLHQYEDIRYSTGNMRYRIVLWRLF